MTRKCKLCPYVEDEKDLFELICRTCWKKTNPIMPLGNRVKRAEELRDKTELAKIEREREIVEFVNESEMSIKKKEKGKFTFDQFANEYIERKILGTNNYKPMTINYESVKILFWRYYTALIYKSKGIIIQPKDMDQERIKFIQNLIMWMLGDYQRIDSEGKTHKAEFDPRQSQIIYGPSNAGKTTIVLAAHHVMESIGKSTRWYQRHFKFESMPAVHFKAYTENSLAELSKFTKNSYAIDDLMEKHFDYQHYGSDFNIVVDIFITRFSLWEKNGTNTIITTNIPPKVLKEKINAVHVWRRIDAQYQFQKLIGPNPIYTN